MAIESLRVEIADNGYELCWCEKTKAPANGQAYQNTIYNDKKEVFMKKDAQALLDRISGLIGVMKKVDDDEAAEGEPSMKMS